MAKSKNLSARDPAQPAALYSAVEGLQRLAEVFDLRRQQLAREAGLTDAQWRVLEEIGRQDFMPSLFARRRECSAAAISRTLRQLQDLGLVAVSISESDARQRDYRLTGSGRRSLARLRQSRERALDAVWSDLPASEVERFGRFSAQLADRLEAYASGRDDR
jgi:DNA-binding MarR family transcriptional regulator